MANLAVKDDIIKEQIVDEAVEVERLEAASVAGEPFGAVEVGLPLGELRFGGSPGGIFFGEFVEVGVFDHNGHVVGG